MGSNEIEGVPIQRPAASSTTALGNAGVYTSPVLGNLNNGYYGSVFADQAGSFIVQVSDDGTNWETVGTSTAVTASTLTKISIASEAAVVRVVYTNGATPQGTFRLYLYASYSYVREN